MASGYRVEWQVAPGVAGEPEDFAADRASAEIVARRLSQRRINTAYVIRYDDQGNHGRRVFHMGGLIGDEGDY